KREFLVPFHGEPRSVKARLLQAPNVIPQLPPIPLVVLEYLALEIRRRLGDILQRSHAKRRVTRDRRAAEIPDPAVFEDPCVQARFPRSAARVDAAANLK